MSLRWFVFFASLSIALAQSPTVSGDYSGTLGPLHLKLHLQQAAAGALTCTLDSPDQGAMGLPCGNVHLAQQTLTFEIPSVGGKWHGTLSPNGATLTGNWSQGAEMPLVFERDKPFLPATKPSRVDGTWLGAISAGGVTLRLQAQIKSDRAGQQYCSVDSLDQGAMNLACDNVRLEGNRFSFDVPSVRGRWAGTLSENGNQLNGSWSQGRDLPLNFIRQTTALAPKPPKYDSALPPVTAGELKTVLDGDLTSVLQHGALAPATAGGVVIGVLQHGTRHLFAYGPVQEDSLFEIGSISKTFTGLMLAQLVEQNKVQLNDPVRDLLPTGVVPQTTGAEITLLDLATQHSGLPRMPDNFHPANPHDPYADYTPANLYAFLAKQGLAKPANATFAYSNLGLGLLGQALANRLNTTYPQLLSLEVTQPLNMPDTVVHLSPDQDKRFTPGHDTQHRAAHPWALDALAGAGGIRSTAADMLTYLEAQLHPDTIRPAGVPSSATIAAAVKRSHELHSDAGPGAQIALAWLYNNKTEIYWHNGATGGYSSFACFNPKEDYAVIVLFNTTVTPTGSFADCLGQHIAQRLSGQPAISLDN